MRSSTQSKQPPKAIANIDGVMYNPAAKLSGPERMWIEHGHGVLRELGWHPMRTWYEPLTFNMTSGIKYTPDFMHLCNDGRILIVEVKRSARQKGYDVTLVRLKTVAAQHPEFYWAMAINTSTSHFRVIFIDNLHGAFDIGGI